MPACARMQFPSGAARRGGRMRPIVLAGMQRRGGGESYGDFGGWGRSTCRGCRGLRSQVRALDVRVGSRDPGFAFRPSAVSGFDIWTSRTDYDLSMDTGRTLILQMDESRTRDDMRKPSKAGTGSDRIRRAPRSQRLQARLLASTSSRPRAPCQSAPNPARAIRSASSRRQRGRPGPAPPAHQRHRPQRRQRRGEQPTTR